MITSIWYLKRALVWLAVIGAASFIILPTLAQTPEQSPSPASWEIVLELDKPVVDFELYSAPDVPDGALWEVTTFPQVQTYSFIPRGNWSDWSQEHEAVLQRARDFQKAGNGEAARDLLLPLVETIPDGGAARYLAFLHEGTTADIPEDPNVAFKWMLRAAEKNPTLYDWLGRKAPDGTNDDLHYWSKGLSRGCTQCLRRLLAPTNIERIGRDRGLRYAVFANEIGDMYAPKLLADLIKDIEANPEGVSPQTLSLAVELRADAEAASGGVLRLGLPIAVQKQTRSGLIHERLRQTAIAIETGTGKGAKGEDALRGIIFGLEGGRYLPVLIDAFMERYPDYDMNVAAKASLILRSVHEGEPRHAAAAAVTSKMRVNRFNHDSSGWRQLPAGPNWMGTDSYLDFGLHHSTIPPATEIYIRSERPTGTAIDLFNRASNCIYDAIANHGDDQYVQGVVLMRCRPAVRDVWTVSSENVDIGLLNDQTFRRLIAATKAARQQMQQKMDDFKVREREARVRQLAEGMVDAERDSRRRLGLPPKYYNNFMEIEEEAQRIVDTARTRAAGDRQIDLAPITAEAFDLTGFYNEYLARKAAVAAGKGGYAGPRESVAVCEYVWSFDWLPACQR